jgi:hypothetical protein
MRRAILLLLLRGAARHPLAPSEEAGVTAKASYFRKTYFRILTAVAAAALAMCLLAMGVAAAPAEASSNGKIAFASDRDFDEAVSNHREEIYVMDADGSNQIRLTNSPQEDLHPTWSPDGEEIAFTTNRDGNDEIYVMNTDGSNQTALIDNLAYDTFPEWEPLDLATPSTVS